MKCTYNTKGILCKGRDIKDGDLFYIRYATWDRHGSDTNTLYQRKGKAIYFVMTQEYGNRLFFGVGHWFDGCIFELLQ